MATATVKSKIRWEFRLAPLVGMAVLTLIAALPLLKVGLVGGEALWEKLGRLGRLAENHLFREITGFALLALILVEVLYSIRKRTQVRLPGDRTQWRSVHMMLGATLIPLVVIHTGGRWGMNLNAWLLTSLFAVVLIGVAGKIGEAVRLRRAVQRAGQGAAAVKASGPYHAAWLWLHTVAVAALVVLLAFHILSVYYF
jgi:nitrite reductase (NADH) large subunit